MNRKELITVLLIIIAIVMDIISRYCWTDSVFIYYFFKQLATSILLYTLVFNLDNIPKIIVESLFILSLYEIIDELCGLGAVDTQLKTWIMLFIGAWTLWRIRRSINRQ